jgi:polysaccharide pyruvyl transferase WcaK-like protein
MMFAIDTEEKFDWIMNALEDREIVLDNRKRTEEDDKEVCKEIAEYKTKRKKISAIETVLV